MAAPAIAGDGPPEPVRTVVDIRHAGDGEFTGRLRSGEKQCMYSRKVVLYREQVGADKRVAFVSTKPRSSRWKISAHRSGVYYARVAATELCAAGTSKRVTYKRFS